MTEAEIRADERRKCITEFRVVGDGDMFQILCKSSSEDEGWVETTKAMEIPNVGCLVQVNVRQRNIDCTYAVAEALTFVANVKIVDDVNGGRRLAKINEGSNGLASRAD